MWNMDLLQPQISTERQLQERNGQQTEWCLCFDFVGINPSKCDWIYLQIYGQKESELLRKLLLTVIGDYSDGNYEVNSQMTSKSECLDCTFVLQMPALSQIFLCLFSDICKVF